MGDVVLSAAEYYVDSDGVHAIRSVDFNVSAHADTFPAAVAMFVDNAEDYCSYLAKLAQEKKATEYELESLGLLVNRVLAVRREREREFAADDLVSTLLRKISRKSAPIPVWRPQTTQTSSEEPSGA